MCEAARDEKGVSEMHYIFFSKTFQRVTGSSTPAKAISNESIAQMIIYYLSIQIVKFM
jgi:hypothetical protein